MIHECWLPELEYFEDYQNSWEIYENALYDIFREDFVNDRPEFEGQSVKFRWHPRTIARRGSECLTFDAVNGYAG